MIHTAYVMYEIHDNGVAAAEGGGHTIVMDAGAEGACVIHDACNLYHALYVIDIA